MQGIVNFLKTLMVYATIILILQFCLNEVTERFAIPPFTIVEVFCGFVFTQVVVFFISMAWHKGK